MEIANPAMVLAALSNIGGRIAEEVRKNFITELPKNRVNPPIKLGRPYYSWQTWRWGRHERGHMVRYLKTVAVPEYLNTVFEGKTRPVKQLGVQRILPPSVAKAVRNAYRRRREGKSYDKWLVSTFPVRGL